MQPTPMAQRGCVGHPLNPWGAVCCERLGEVTPLVPVRGGCWSTISSLRMAVVVHGWWRHCSLVTALLLCLRVSDGYWSRWWSVARPRWCSKVLFWLRSAKFWWVVLGSPGTARGCLRGIPACGVADLGGQREALGCVQSYLHRYGFAQPFWYVIHGTLWNSSALGRCFIVLVACDGLFHPFLGCEWRALLPYCLCSPVG